MIIKGRIIKMGNRYYVSIPSKYYSIISKYHNKPVYVVIVWQ